MVPTSLWYGEAMRQKNKEVNPSLPPIRKPDQVQDDSNTLSSLNSIMGIFRKASSRLSSIPEESTNIKAYK